MFESDSAATQSAKISATRNQNSAGSHRPIPFANSLRKRRAVLKTAISSLPVVEARAEPGC